MPDKAKISGEADLQRGMSQKLMCRDYQQVQNVISVRICAIICISKMSKPPAQRLCFFTYNFWKSAESCLKDICKWKVMRTISERWFYFFLTSLLCCLKLGKNKVPQYDCGFLHWTTNRLNAFASRFLFTIVHILPVKEWSETVQMSHKIHKTNYKVKNNQHLRHD